MSNQMVYIRISGPSDVSLAEVEEYDPPLDGVEFRVRRSPEHMFGGGPEVILVLGIAKQVIAGVGYATAGALIADWAMDFFGRHRAKGLEVTNTDGEDELNATIQAIDADHPEREHAVGEATTVRTSRQFVVTFETTVTRQAGASE